MITRLGTALLLLLVAVLALNSYQGREHHIQQVEARGTLVALTHNAPTTVYEGREGLAGFEYDLLKDFADYLGVKLQVVYKDGMEELFSSLEAQNGDLAAANLTRLPEREQRMLFGPTYFTAEQQLVCRRGRTIPASFDEIDQVFILVIAGSSYEVRMRELARQYPEMRWAAVEGFTTRELLEMVWEEQITCTVADSHIVALNQRYFPELEVAFPVSAPQELAWALPRGSTGLKRKLEAWKNDADQRGIIAQAQERHFSHVAEFDYVDTRRFLRRIETRLPHFIDTFYAAAEESGLEWELLAAQSYQESHWNPRAKSPTGVRGMMMLTLSTARVLGVKNRLDPEESIRGGGTYLARLRDRLDPAIQDPDRTWMALAAYNVGDGHLEDARKLAMRLGRDPNQWQVIKEILPLLEDPDYYRSLEFGYARGSEPVQYVQAIREYYDLLLHHLQQQEGPQLETAPAADGGSEA